MSSPLTPHRVHRTLASMSPSHAPQWTPESLSQLATGYWHSQALSAAIELGVFDLLPAAPDDLAARASLNPRLTRQLLEALTAMQLLTRQGDTFTLAPEAAPFLLSTSPTTLAPALRFNAAMYGLWGNLPALIRTGTPASPGQHLGRDPGFTRAFTLAMHSRGLALLPKAADAIDLSQARQVLDVGSGAGTLSRLLAERHKNARFTLLDLPAITDIARELTAGHPEADRITHLAGDYFKAALPGPVDAVLYCGALHQHDPAAAGTLITRLAGALRPGGKLIVIDLLANNARSGPAFSLLFGLNMSLVTPSSHLHSTTDVETYLKNANLAVSPPITPQGSIYTIVTATR